MTLRNGILVLMASAGCAGRATPEGRLVARLPESAEVWWVDVTQDGSTAAYAERRDGLAYLTVGSTRYGPYT